MRILVVEDDRLLNNTLCYNLDTAGYAVDSALTKSAASNFLTKQDYDLIVLDVNLPDGNGFDFCREVKERRPDTAVIFLTANDMESDIPRVHRHLWCSMERVSAISPRRIRTLALRLSDSTGIIRAASPFWSRRVRWI